MDPGWGCVAAVFPDLERSSLFLVRSLEAITYPEVDGGDASSQILFLQVASLLVLFPTLLNKLGYYSICTPNSLQLEKVLIEVHLELNY